MINIVLRSRFLQLSRLFNKNPIGGLQKSYAFSFLRQSNKKKKESMSQQNLDVHERSEHHSQAEQKPALFLRKSINMKLNVAQTFQQLMSQTQIAFSQKSYHLAQFLHKLYKYLSPQNLKSHRKYFDEVDSKINSFTSTLSMTAIQYIQILRFHSKLRVLTNNMAFLHSHGFEKKASIIGATFIHNKQLTFNQTVLVFKLLAPLGGISILFFMNFIKYFKSIAISDSSKDIKIDHLLTLLNLKFIKRNQIIIEHTLYDHLLHYLLSNLSSLIENQSLTIKVETLCTLLLFDSRNNYRSDPHSKIYWITYLLREISAKMDENWVREFWQQKQISSLLINARQTIYILQCITFAKKNMIEFDSLLHQFQNIINRVFQIFEKECSTQQNSLIKLNERSFGEFVRFVFNPQITSLWIKRKTIQEKVFKLVLSINIKDESEIESFISLINSNSEQSENKLKLIELAKDILTKHLKKKVVLQALILTYIQRVSHQIALRLLLSKSMQTASESNDKLFFDFAMKICMSSKEKKGDNLAQKTQRFTNNSEISIFLNNLYSLSLNSQSPKGYASALQLLSLHFQQISQFLLSDDKINSNRSPLNTLLSESSYYFAWIIFVNLMNGVSVNYQLLLFYERLIKNDIIKYQMLSNYYEYAFPQPNQYPKPKLTTENFNKSMQFLMKSFQNEDKYASFIWDIFLKRYIIQSPSVREESFTLLEECFLRAYKKQNLRKVIMVTVLTNYISSGVIIGSRLKLQSLFERIVDQLMGAEEMIEYHYSCYLQIIFNAISADILSPLYYDKIMVHSIQKDKDIKSTCSLMLMYGASLKSRNQVGGVIEHHIIGQQSNYLKFLIKNGTICKQKFNKDVRSAVKGQRREVEITSKLISIMFSFGFPEIITIEKAVYEFLSNHNDYAEWRCMVNCYVPENYSMNVKKEALFRGRVNQIMIDKLIYFKKLNLISKSEESYFINKFK